MVVNHAGTHGFVSIDGSWVVRASSAVIRSSLKSVGRSEASACYSGARSLAPADNWKTERRTPGERRMLDGHKKGRRT